MQPEASPEPDQKELDSHRLDFIRETELKKPKSFVRKLRTPIGLVFLGLCAGLLAVLITIPIVANQRANQAQVDKLTSLAQTQTEIIRVASFATEQSKQSITKSRAASIAKTVGESLEATESLLNDRKVDESQLILGANKNSQTDSDLVEAIQKDSFDEAFAELIDEQLLEYQRTLLELQQTSNEREKQVLEAAYNKVNDLLGLVDEE